MKPCRWMIGLLVALGEPSWAASSPDPASPPEVLSWVAPDYPQAAQEAELTPRVEVVVQVDENGGVLKASSADSFPQGITEACEEAARQWRFVPGGASSRAVHLVFSFVLDRSGSRLRTPPEVLSPYHIRVWGHFWGEPTTDDKLPCLEEGSDFTLTRPEPRVLSWEAPSYTEVARKARLAGTVVVVARVDSKGRVVWECAQKSLPMGLSKASEEVVERWRFAPDPQPMRWVEVEVEFATNDAEELDRPAELLSPYHLRVWSNTPELLYSPTVG